MEVDGLEASSVAQFQGQRAVVDQPVFGQVQVLKRKKMLCHFNGSRSRNLVILNHFTVTITESIKKIEFYSLAASQFTFRSRSNKQFFPEILSKQLLSKKDTTLSLILTAKVLRKNFVPIKVDDRNKNG